MVSCWLLLNIDPLSHEAGGNEQAQKGGKRNDEVRTDYDGGADSGCYNGTLRTEMGEDSNDQPGRRGDMARCFLGEGGYRDEHLRDESTH